MPMGIEWLEHLDALGAIRLSSGITTLKKFSEYYPGVLTGYACVGIKKGSEEHKKAVELLSTVNIGLSGLADNCFLDGYVRLEIVNKNHIDSLKIADSEGVHNIRPDEKKIFDDIWNMYEKNSALQNKVSRAFIDEWDSFESLKKYISGGIKSLLRSLLRRLEEYWRTQMQSVVIHLCRIYCNRRNRK